jgi:hypothetical protein
MLTWEKRGKEFALFSDLFSYFPIECYFYIKNVIIFISSPAAEREEEKKSKMLDFMGISIK